MARPAAWLFVASVALGACGDPASEPQVETVAVERKAAEAEVASFGETSIEVGRLTSSGFVVDTGKSVVFVDPSGKELLELPGLSLGGNLAAAGLWLEGDTKIFKLDAARGRLVPVPRRAARRRMYDEGRPPDLPIPTEAPRIDGRIVGSWRYAYRSSTGETLALWSGECEIPTAYWIAPGGEPRIVTGGTDLASAPESIALGWAPDGRAIVYVRKGTCGSGGAPGIYAFEEPGEGELLYPTRRGSHSAEMWQR